MATTKYEHIVKKMQEAERLMAGKSRMAKSTADQLEDVFRSANKVLSEMPNIKEEDTYSDWEDTFIFIPKESVYTHEWIWGPAYKRKRTKQKSLYMDGKRISGIPGGMIVRALGKAKTFTEYATGEEIFEENIKRAGNNDLQN